ncbi:MAG: glycosyltransferase family 4 protein [bacterium]
MGRGRIKIPVIQVITKLELGGAQQLALHLAREINRDLFQPYLICGKGGLLDQDVLNDERIRVHWIPHMIREIRPHLDVMALGEIRHAIRRILSGERQVKMSIIHTHSSKAGILGRWAARLERIPVILHTYHGFGFHDFQPRVLRLVFETVEILTSRISHGLVMVSRANQKKAIHCGIRPKLFSKVIYGGIELQEFLSAGEHAEGKRRELGLDDGHKVVSMISCLKPQKAPLDFVRLAGRVGSEISEARFLLVGDGDLRSQVAQAVARSGLQGRFQHLGWRRDVASILGLTDVLVLTSLWEGFPLTLLQAMAAGVPAVVTRVDGSPEAILDGVNGFVVEPRDVEAMAARVIQLLRDPQLRSRMGEEGRKRVQDFDIDHMVRKQEEFYLELVEAVLKGKNQCQ